MNYIKTLSQRLDWLRVCTVVAASAFAAGFAGGTLAQTPERISNIEQSMNLGVCQMEELGGQLVVSAARSPFDCRLYAIDAGFSTVSPLLDDRSVGFYQRFGNRLVVGACSTEFASSCGLWVTDGTRAGTQPLSPALPIGRMPIHMQRRDDRLLFAIRASSGVLNWWSTQGTAETTVPVGTSPSPNGPWWVTVTDSGIYWIEKLYSRSRLIKVPFATGTQVVAFEFGSDQFHEVRAVATRSHIFIFEHRISGESFAYSVADSSLEAQTLLQAPSQETTYATATDQFSAFIWCASRIECSVWRSDGTASGTKAITQSASGLAAQYYGVVRGAAPNQIFASGTYGLYVLDQNGERRLAAGEVLRLTPAAQGAVACTRISGSSEIWRSWYSDGTAVGTFELDGGCASVAAVSDDGASVYKYREDYPSDLFGRTPRLRKFDRRTGTVQPLNGTPSLGASFFGAVGQRADRTAVFNACNAESGCELWRSDGTRSGTRQLADLVPGREGSFPSGFATFGANTYFFVRTGDASVATPSSTSAADVWLAVTDGTSSGTRRVKSLGLQGHPLGERFVEFQGGVYFSSCAPNDASKCGLWITDGTESGTRLAVPLPPGFAGSPPVPITSAGKMLFQWCVTGSACHVYASDGSAVGTTMIATIRVGGISLLPIPRFVSISDFAVLGSSAYFIECIEEDRRTCRIVRTDLTSTGINLAADVFPMTGLLLEGLVRVGDRMMVLSKEDWTSPTKLWLLSPGDTPQEIASGAFMSQLAIVGNRLFFSYGAELGGLSELWVFDVSRGKLERVRHISYIQGYVATQRSLILFPCATSDTCDLIQVSVSGNESSALSLRRSMSGATISNPVRPYFAVGDRLVYVANDDAEGGELWAIDLPRPVDSDDDGVPDATENIVGSNPAVRDNDVFADTDLGRRRFVMQQYRDFLRREASETEVLAGVAALTAGESRAAMIERLVRSPIVQDAAGPIARLYSAYFLRVPDLKGYDFWITEYLRQNPWTFIGISNFFASSGEFQQRYGTLTSEQFVSLIYQNVLSRAADRDGYSFWVSELSSGRRSRGQVMADFSESPENKVLSQSLVQISVLYAFMLRAEVDASQIGRYEATIRAGGSIQPLINSLMSDPRYRARFLE